MKLYRDLTAGETLQAGDERMSGNSREWVPVEAVLIGQPVPADMLVWCRRPVNLPVLQPVTLEAILQLEGDEIRTIAVLSQGSAKTMTWNTQLQRWFSNAGFDTPLEWQWFIDLSAIPEVQQ